VRILTDDPGGVRSLKPGSDATDLVRDLDGKRLGALRVTSIKELRPEERQKLTPIDHALAVTKKHLFSTNITLDERTIELTSLRRSHRRRLARAVRTAEPLKSRAAWERIALGTGLPSCYPARKAPLTSKTRTKSPRPIARLTNSGWSSS